MKQFGFGKCVISSALDSLKHYQHDRGGVSHHTDRCPVWGPAGGCCGSTLLFYLQIGRFTATWWTWRFLRPLWPPTSDKTVKAAGLSLRINEVPHYYMSTGMFLIVSRLIQPVHLFNQTESLSVCSKSFLKHLQAV